MPPMTLPPRLPANEDPLIDDVAQSMRAFSGSMRDRLPESVKAHHRTDLLTLAAHTSAPTAGSESPVQKISWWSKKVFVYASALAVFVLVLNLVIAALPSKQGRVALERLVIPVAQAESFFQLTPVRRLPSGIDPQAGWKLTSSTPVSREALARAVRIEPPADVRIEQDGAAWRIVPNEVLDENTLYRVGLAAALQEGEQEIPYEYSWVDQTTGVFSLEGMSPAPQASSVPANAAIEMSFSHSNLRDPEGFVLLEPAVPGRFERRDRSVIFLPDRPLTAGAVYRVTLKQGFGVEGDAAAQTDRDMSYTFQVAMTQQDSSEASRRLYVPEQVSVRTDDGIRMPVTVVGRAEPLSVELFRVNVAQAEQYLHARLGDFRSYAWYPAMNAKYEALLTGMTPHAVFPAVSLTQTPNEYGGSNSALNLPRQAQGLYLARIRSARVSEYVLVQVSDIAAHAITDQESALVWAVDTVTKAPIEGVRASIRTVEARTNAEGTASLRLDYAGQAQELGQGSLDIIRLERDTDVVLLPLMQDRFGAYATEQVTRPTWAALSLDRLVQREGDTLSLFGLVVDRETNTPAQDAHLEIRPHRPMFWYGYGPDWSQGVSPVLYQQPVQPDAYGRFSATFSWEGMKAGMYTVAIMRGEQEVRSAIFSVTAAKKPAVRISLEPKTEFVMAGQAAEVIVKASFMDGTPYIGAEVELESYGARANTNDTFRQRVTLNEAGEATARIQTDPFNPCLVQGEDFSGYCAGNRGFLSVTARVATGEEGQMQAQATIEVYPAAVFVRGERNAYAPDVTVREGVLTAGGIVEDFDPNQSPKVLRPVREGTAVAMNVFRRYEDRVQTGTVYNEVTKTTDPVYTIQFRYVSVGTRQTVTKADGAFVMELPVERDGAYVVVLSTKDTRGRTSWMLGYPAEPVSIDASQPGMRTLQLFSGAGEELAWNDVMPFESSREVRAAFAPGEELPATASKPLFVLAARGIQGARIATNNRFTVQMNKALYPSVTVHVAVLTDEGFKTAERTFAVRQDDFALTLEASTDQARYEPGQNMLVRTRVRDAAGRAVQDARVVVSVADDALASLGAFSSETFLSKLYGYQDSGILTKASTHLQASAMNGGAEGGGGGVGEILASPRRDFRDQAVFTVLTTNEEGWVEGRVTLPDNVTTWRVQVIALSPDRFVGETVLYAEAGKSLAVDAVVPETLVVGDEARLKLRAISAGANAETAFTYALQAPTLGITEQAVQKKGLDPVYIPLTITREMLGEHVLTVGVRSGGKTDAQEVRVRVTEPESMKRVWESKQALPGMTLPEQDEPFVNLLLTSQSRVGILSEMYRIASEGDSSRLEARLAARSAYQYLTAAGASEGDAPAIEWDTYRTDAGFRALPYSDTSLHTTLSALMSDGTPFEQKTLRPFLERIARDTKASREDRLWTLLGLGLTGKPVIDEWRSVAAREDLSWQEEAVLLRGCIELGDDACARALYARWMAGAEERDGGIKVQRGESELFAFAQTRLALYAAEYLLDDRREALRVGLSRLPKGEGSYDPVLDMAILAQRLAKAPVEETSITYSIDGKTSTQVLTHGAFALNLDRASWQRFRVESVTGPVALEWRRLVPGVVTSSEGLRLERTYEPLDDRAVMRPGDMVRVTLKPSFSKRDTYGCYEIRDTLPANLRTDVMGYGLLERGWYPAVPEPGVVSFIACAAYADSISYTARVVAPGTYGAYPAVMQHLEEPSLSATSNPSRLTVQE